MIEVDEHARTSGYFESADLDELRRARELIAEASAWMNLRYHEISGHPLALLSHAQLIAPSGTDRNLIHDRS
jgi:hypothetical protein